MFAARSQAILAACESVTPITTASGRVRDIPDISVPTSAPRSLGSSPLPETQRSSIASS
ncbi:hypothetical protein MA5S0422_2791 [Mycobacteroides abscessus 5S-0422]|nr:hypothetical protein MA5S0422_2791 [Mycobacteroides abscessus 5S-0422]